MQDVIGRVVRELPDTDKSRYDIAYERGRAQARSAYVFGGLGIGALLGAGAAFFFDPANGTRRRAGFAQQLTARSNELRRSVEGRSKDLRNRLEGRAIEAGMIPPPEEHPTEAERVADELRATQRRVVARSGVRTSRSEEPEPALR